LRNESLLCCGLIFGVDLKMADSFISNVTRSAEQEAAAHGLCLLQSHWQDSFEESWPRMQAVFSVGGLCGVVLAGQFSSKEVQSFQQHAKNVVILDGPAPAGITVATVEPDYADGCWQAIQHLLERGSKRILVITGESKDHYFSKAMISVAEVHRHQFEKIEVVPSNLTLEMGYEIAHQYFSKGLPFDGIFGNDETVIGVLSALSHLNLLVPEDVKVIGFDDISYSRFTNPPLTTVRIDKNQMGREAVRTLVEIVRGKDDLTQIKKVLKANLVVRQST
jgi:DNA-binding LacI/PurR family transcriptional regulator